MKTGDVINIVRAINALKQNTFGATAKFTYALGVNSRRAAPIAESFDDAYRNIANEHAKKDEDGNPIIDKAGSPIIENVQDFLEAAKELEAVEVDFQPHMIDIEQFPDGLPTHIGIPLMLIVRDPVDAEAA